MCMDRFLRALAFDAHNVFINGSVGSGKTGLSFKFIENAHKLNPKRAVYIHNYPEESLELLPDWFNLEKDITAIPYGALVLKDDTSLDDATHSKGSKGDQKGFAQEMALCRQKKHTLIFNVQNTYWLSKDLGRAGNNHYVYKWYDDKSLQDEREEVKGIIYAVKEVMKQMIKEGYKREALAYVSSEYFHQGFITSTLPSFWSQDLSEVLGRVRC